MNLSAFSIALSLALTVVFLLYSGTLLKAWWSSVKTALTHIDFYKFWKPIRTKELWTKEQWLCVGIFSGFVANALDNLYWGLAWLEVYLGWPMDNFLMRNGATANIFIRQLGGIWAVYCHVVAAQMFHKEGSDKVNNPAFWFSGAFIMFLLLLRPLMEI